MQQTGANRANYRARGAGADEHGAEQFLHCLRASRDCKKSPHKNSNQVQNPCRTADR
jgi:hypothetical protein